MRLGEISIIFFLIFVSSFYFMIGLSTKIEKKEENNIKTTINEIANDTSIVKVIFLDKRSLYVVYNNGLFTKYRIDDKTVYKDNTVLSLKNKEQTWYFIENSLVSLYLKRETKTE